VGAVEVRMPLYSAVVTQKRQQVVIAVVADDIDRAAAKARAMLDDPDGVWDVQVHKKGAFAMTLPYRGRAAQPQNAKTKAKARAKRAKAARAPKRPAPRS
jgi:hypothetical protein